MSEEIIETALYSANCPNTSCPSHGREEMIESIVTATIVCGDCGRWLHNIPEDLTPEQRARAGLNEA